VHCYWLLCSLSPAGNSEEKVHKSGMTEEQSSSGDIEAPNDQKQLTEVEIVEISKTIDLLRTQPPLVPMLIALGISFIQFMTYIAILYSNENGVDKSQNQFYIIITLIFATLAITNAGIPLWVELMSGGVTVIAKLLKCQIQPLKIILIGFEITNFSLLFITAITIVPAQGKPLDIVLNCTALLIIAELDDGYFQCFPCKAPIDKVYAAQAERFDVTMNTAKKVMYGLGLIGNFLIILIMYSVYYVNVTDSDDL
jgi:hypothetical protein